MLKAEGKSEDRKSAAADSDFRLPPSDFRLASSALPLPMPITALAPWFGGKRNLAPLIVAELGKHRVYWEPFCGSMAVLLAKPPCVMETVNDLHELLINLARVIKDPRHGPLLYRMLRRTLMHEDFFAESDKIIRQIEQGRARALPDVMRAYHYFLASWLGRNGTAGTPESHKGTYCVRFTSNGGHAAKRWNSVIASIPAWRRRMANVTILNRDGIELLDRIDDAPGTAIYCDPPYLVKGATYIHDFEASDHAKLEMALMRFKRARVVVSYYDHPTLATMYDGWTRVRVEVSRAMANAGRRGVCQSTATEVLLINGPSYSQARGMFDSPTGPAASNPQSAIHNSCFALRSGFAEQGPQSGGEAQ
jgi:DNA adenine methylase